MKSGSRRPFCQGIAPDWEISRILYYGNFRAIYKETVTRAEGCLQEDKVLQ